MTTRHQQISDYLKTLKVFPKVPDPLVTLTPATIHTESINYKPGYADSVLSSLSPTGEISSAMLASIRRQFSIGCCGQ